MTGALAAMSSAAPAAFLYVPPTAPALEEAVDQNSTEAPGQTPEGDETRVTVQPPAGGAEVEDWRARSGETLREVLNRWGPRAGVEVLFLTDRRYRLHEGRVFEGSFAEASQALFSALSHLPRPPVGVLRSDGRTIAVMHRVRGLGDGR